MKALDLFCGAGGASMGLKQAGFELTGVDIAPQKRYPFTFIQKNALDVTLKGYDFIWASPPCQAFSLAQRIRKRAHPDLVEPIRKRLKRWGGPYVIENVIGAPLINPVELCGAMFGLKVYRHRIFESNFAIKPPEHLEHLVPTTKMGRKYKEGEFMHVVGNFSGVDQARLAMGIHWMSRDELREAIPPAFSKFIAEQFMRLIA
jgi:DNA (cytosine-5)-methyltransferase 1